MTLIRSVARQLLRRMASCTGLMASATLCTVTQVARAQPFPAELEAPAALGPHAVSVTDYGSPTQVFSVGGVPSELYTRILFPSDLDNGPYPLVLFLHGDHATCMAPFGPAPSPADEWPCESPNVPINSHWGFQDVGEILASHGFLVGTISANGMNAAPNNLGTAPREALLNGHLGAWQVFNQIGDISPGYFNGPGVTGSIQGAVDLGNVALVGHSKGGQAIVAYANNYAGSEWQIKALMPIAPVGVGPINHVPIATLLGYCDGDTEDLPGVRLFDDARYNSPVDAAEKYTFFVPGANHNFFNAMWSHDHYPGPFPTPTHVTDDALPDYVGDIHCDPNAPGSERLTGAEQRAISDAYILAFLRRHLLGETQFDSFLVGDVAPPPSTLTSSVQVAYHAPASDRFDLDRLDDEGLFENSLNSQGGETEGESLSRFESCQGSQCIDQERTGHSYRRLALGWNSGPAYYSSMLPFGEEDVSSFATLQFRVGVDHTSALNAGTDRNLRVELEDGNGAIASAVVDDFSNALAFPPGDDSEVRMSLMSTVRIPMAMFINLDLTDIVAVHLTFDEVPSGAIYLSDLAFVDSTTNLDYLWISGGDRSFASSRLALGREYRVLAGDFDDSGSDDIFLYAPGTGSDVILWADGSGGFTPQATGVSGTYIPLVGNFDGQQGDDIFWYGPGSISDSIWWSDGDRSFSGQSRPVSGTYRPIVGDFDADGADDIFWYGGATSADSIWWSNGDRTFTSQARPVSGTQYQPFAGDFDGDGAVDIYWYGPGSVSDSIWWSDGDRSFSGQSRPVSGTYRPIVGNFDGQQGDDIFWYGPGSISDSIWWSDGDRSFSGQSRPVSGHYQPVSGDFDADADADVLWYNP